MNEHDRNRLQDMLDAARRAMAFAEGKERTDLDKDHALIGYAIVRALEIIGEAARTVSEDTREDIADIPWVEIIGMRHRIAHDYLNVDFDIVWEVVTKDLAILIEQLEAALSTSDSN